MKTLTINVPTFADLKASARATAADARTLAKDVAANPKATAKAVGKTVSDNAVPLGIGAVAGMLIAAIAVKKAF